MSLIRKHVAVLQAWACLDLVGKRIIGIMCVKIVKIRLNLLSYLRKTVWSFFPDTVNTVFQKRPTLSLCISSPNIDRFSKLFQCHTLWKICNKDIIKYPNIPQRTSSVATLPCSLSSYSCFCPSLLMYTVFQKKTGTPSSY